MNIYLGVVAWMVLGSVGLAQEGKSGTIKVVIEDVLAGQGQVRVALEDHAADRLGVGWMAHAVDHHLSDAGLAGRGLGRSLVIDRRRKAIERSGVFEGAIGCHDEGTGRQDR